MMTSDTNFIEFALGIKDSNLIFRGYFINLFGSLNIESMNSL